MEVAVRTTSNVAHRSLSSLARLSLPSEPLAFLSFLLLFLFALFGFDLLLATLVLGWKVDVHTETKKQTCERYKGRNVWKETALA